MQFARNCGGKFSKSRFKLQLLNNEILYECPNTYFDSWLFDLYSSYNHLKLKKELGIKTEPENVSLLELEACGVIMSETSKVNDAKMKKNNKTQDKKNASRSNNPSRIPYHGRR